MGRGDTLSRARIDVRPEPELGCLTWPGLVFEREHLCSLGVYASCWTVRGDFWEYEEGTFYLTELRGDRRRRRVWDMTLVPEGPWHHHDHCDCEVCRLSLA